MLQHSMEVSSPTHVVDWAVQAAVQQAALVSTDVSTVFV